MVTAVLEPLIHPTIKLKCRRRPNFDNRFRLDPDGIPHFGLVAEELERVNPDLVVRGEDAKVMTVRYEAVNAMLLNEFLKEHRKVDEQQRINQQQESTIAELESDLRAVTTALKY